MPEELRPRLLKTPYELIHHVLAFAQLVFSEGATMASEAAVLGTHALYVNTIVSRQHARAERALPSDGLLQRGRGPLRAAAARAEELLATPGLKEIGLEKQKKLLSEKVDINGYYMAEMDRLAKAGRKG